MSEEELGPAREFLLGCATGFVFLLWVVPILYLCIIFLFNAVGVTRDMSFENIASGLVALGLVGVIAWLAVLLARMARRAFLEKRFYHGLGLLTFLIIPLLFFGLCTVQMMPR